MPEKLDVGIMQPYFFPFLGHFDLINRTSKWIVFDVIEFRSRTFMSRNRVLEPNRGEQYISLPVNKKTGPKMSDIRVFEPQVALQKNLGQLRVYQNKAPYYDEVITLIEQAFNSAASDLLRDINVQTVKLACERFGIDFDYAICSELNLDFSNIEHAGSWALEICKQLSANSYLNPPGGRDLFIKGEWDQAGIELYFANPPTMEYETHYKLPFRADLSIVDVMMWNSPESIKECLDSCKEPVRA